MSPGDSNLAQCTQYFRDRSASELSDLRRVARVEHADAPKREKATLFGRRLSSQCRICCRQSLRPARARPRPWG
eukprot:1076848-Prymnesium_polylepis.1